MKQEWIFYPVFFLVALTFFVFLKIPLEWYKKMLLWETKIDDFKLWVWPLISNRNYMNLLEMPILFYLVITLIFITKQVDILNLSLAGIYVFLRYIHTIIHLTSNKVYLRATVFGLSNMVLFIIWIKFALNIINS